jgi:hypothetical protein
MRDARGDRPGHPRRLRARPVARRRTENSWPRNVADPERDHDVVPIDVIAIDEVLGLETLADAVNRIKYPGLDLSNIFWTVPTTT